MLQWNTISVLLIYDWQHLLRNTSESSLMLLNYRCLQSFTYSVSLLWLQFSTLNCQYFQKIGYLTCRHTFMVSLDIPYLVNPLERSDRWLIFWSLSKLLWTKPFWHLLVILWFLKNSWILEWSVTLMILILPS